MLKSYLEKEEDGLVTLHYYIGWSIPWITNIEKSQSIECSEILWILWGRP